MTRDEIVQFAKQHCPDWYYEALQDLLRQTEEKGYSRCAQDCYNDNGPACECVSAAFQRGAEAMKERIWQVVPLGADTEIGRLILDQSLPTESPATGAQKAEEAHWRGYEDGRKERCGDLCLKTAHRTESVTQITPEDLTAAANLRTMQDCGRHTIGVRYGGEPK